MKTAFVTVFGFVLIICATLFFFTSNAQTNDDPSIAEQTRKALSTVEKLLNVQNASSYGLRDAKQITEYKPARPIVLNMITLAAIKSYRNGDNIKDKLTLLNDKRLIPLLNKENRLSDLSIELEKRGGKWEFSNFGKSTTSTTFNESIANKPNESTPIWIPALRVEAIGYTDSKGTMTIEIISSPDNERISAVKGKRIGSDQFFGLLKPLATAYNGLPW